MALELEELPLFPLNTVLFPYAQIQLHVFEDRYRDLVRDCLAYDRPFGIVLIRTGKEVGGDADPYMVGTVVRIVNVQQFDDGRMDIQVQGERRFRIRRLLEPKPYLVGLVEPLIELEIEDSPRVDALTMKAREEFQMLVQSLFAKQDFNVEVRFPTDPTALSFTIANLLPMENLEKQRLLETTDTTERLKGLIPILQRQNLEAHQPAYYRVGRQDLQEWINPN
jgi:uncharacterized protein